MASKNKTRSPTEISVDDAANQLQVSARTILNYIRAKEIDAIKVGKSWFINHASFLAFTRKYQLAIAEIPVNQASGEVGAPPPELAPPAPAKKYRLTNLRLFEKLHAILLTLQAPDIFPSALPLFYQQRWQQLQLEALEWLGIGYYSYGVRAKVTGYQRSREKVAGILALSYHLHPKSTTTPPPFVSVLTAIEEELMPMYAALIRKLEKKDDK